MEPIVLIAAFGAGLLFRLAGYPPLLGYLVAGFVAHSFGIGSSEGLQPLADAGIILLLFTIGLKLKVRSLSAPYVWGAAILHVIITVPLTAAVILFVGVYYSPLSFDHSSAAWILAFALSFSSTVFAVKMFEERGESKSFFGSIAIGILVVQDVMAVVYLVLASGQYPSPWALGLIGLFFVRRPLAKLLNLAGHGELLVLLGVTLAFVSGALFEFLHLKAGLGALLAGMLVMVADEEKAKELYRQLATLKNLLLIGFIVQIGYYGIPSLGMLFVAGVLALLILLRPVIYFSLLTLFGLRARTGFLVGLSLFTYSEFGLIVAAYAAEAGILSAEWITTLALGMAVSFLLATPLNKIAHETYRKYQTNLTRLEKPVNLEVERIGALGSARVAVLGMGRVGKSAYRALKDAGHEDVVGIEERYELTQQLGAEGYHCVHGDASDRDFWERTKLAKTDLIMVSLSNHRENIAIVRLSEQMQFRGKLAVAARFPDEKSYLESKGCVAVYLYEDVGRNFADTALAAINQTKHSETDLNKEAAKKQESDPKDGKTPRGRDDT